MSEYPGSRVLDIFEPVQGFVGGRDTNSNQGEMG